MRGSVPWNLPFLTFRSAPEFLSKSQQWQRAPWGLGWRLLAQQLYLLTWLYYFLLYFFSLWDDGTFASRPNPKHLEVCFFTLLSTVWSYLWTKYRYLHSLCKKLVRTVLILPKALTCNDDFSGTGPDPALEIITGICQCQALGNKQSKPVEASVRGHHREESPCRHSAAFSFFPIDVESSERNDFYHRIPSVAPKIRLHDLPACLGMCSAECGKQLAFFLVRGHSHMHGRGSLPGGDLSELAMKVKPCN